MRLHVSNCNGCVSLTVWTFIVDNQTIKLFVTLCDKMQKGFDTLKCLASHAN